MADAIESEYGVTPELISGRGGVFDVKCDDKMVYSKHDTGRFPEHSEVIEALKALR
ncbi:MAG: Rdx family protein [Phycisphaerales bacterium]|nr:Rdx family protein [Phycisphaerales bacterium]